MPAVTELVIAELLYLQWMDPRQPTYVYINSTGTSRADGETVSEYTIRRQKAVKWLQQLFELSSSDCNESVALTGSG